MLLESKAFGSFSVDNIEKARAFYSDVLGLNVTENAMGILILQLEGDSFFILYPKNNHVPATFTVLNFPVDDVENTVVKLISKGIIFEQYKELNTEGPLIAWFKDSAGNILSVIEKKKESDG